MGERLSPASIWGGGQERFRTLEDYAITQPDILSDAKIETCVAEFWCPFCGGWHGGGAPPRPAGAREMVAPRVPDVIRKIVEAEVGPYPRSETDHPREQSRWQDGGFVDGRPARVRESGRKVEALWGGEYPEGDGPKHGHIISHDGTNANFVAEPGAEGPTRDTPVDDRRLDPYDKNQRPSRSNYSIDPETGTYNFD